MGLRFLTTMVILCPCAGLFGCGSCNHMTPANRSIIGTWNGTITPDAGKALTGNLSMSITFTSSGGSVTGDGVLALMNDTSFDPSTKFLVGGATFPVSVSGNQATFSTTFSQNGSSFLSKNLESPFDSIVIVVPGSSVPSNPMNFTINVGDSSLTGSYQINGNPPMSGTVSLTRSTPPAPIDGHWTGSMTSDQGQLGATIDVNYASKSSIGDRFQLSGNANQISSQFVKNTWDASGGGQPDGILVGNMWFGHFDFVTRNPTGTSATGRIFPHRYFSGTVNGNTISGNYMDETQGGVVPSDTGTFTLTKQTPM